MHIFIAVRLFAGFITKQFALIQTVESCYLFLFVQFDAYNFVSQQKIWKKNRYNPHWSESSLIPAVKYLYIMCFKPKYCSNLYRPDLLLSGKVTSNRRKHLYLGIKLDDNLNDELDLKRHENSLHRRGNVFVSHFKDCSTEVKDYLFKTHFSTAYGCQLWTTYHRNLVMTRISVPYNDVYRWLFQIRRGVSISAIFVSKGVLMCSEDSSFM